MSTGATVTVYDEHDSFHLYIYCDGWPEMVIPEIESATKFSWEFPRFEAWDFATALIKVMKIWAWKIYLINDVESISGRCYHYEVSKKDWDLKIKIDSFI